MASEINHSVEQQSNPTFTKSPKELRRELSLIQATRDTEHNLPEELKHRLWLEAKQINEYLDGDHYAEE